MEGTRPSTSPRVPTFLQGNLGTAKMSCPLACSSVLLQQKMTKTQHSNSLSTLNLNNFPSQKSNVIKNTWKILNPKVMIYLVLLDILFVSANLL